MHTVYASDDTIITDADIIGAYWPNGEDAFFTLIAIVNGRTFTRLVWNNPANVTLWEPSGINGHVILRDNRADGRFVVVDCL